MFDKSINIDLKSYGTLSRIKIKNNTPRYITVKVPNTKDKENILKVSRGKKGSFHKKKKNKNAQTHHQK